ALLIDDCDDFAHENLRLSVFLDYSTHFVKCKKKWTPAANVSRETFRRRPILERMPLDLPVQ
ncbi:MAG: hypothetical protein VZQ75_01410, partial [Candidatus Faecousia sp.]|nr:hypothetical protein [Candidatus Faecousia sp.]